MSEFVASLSSSVPAVPQRTHASITFYRSQMRDGRRPSVHFRWKDIQLRGTRQGYDVGSDWTMTTFDNRTNDQFFDSKRLQTIDEATEVQFFHPYDPLGYSRDGVDFGVVEEVRRLDLHKPKYFLERLFIGAKLLLNSS